MEEVDDVDDARSPPSSSLEKLQSKNNLSHHTKTACSSSRSCTLHSRGAPRPRLFGVWFGGMQVFEKEERKRERERGVSVGVDYDDWLDFVFFFVCFALLCSLSLSAKERCSFSFLPPLMRRARVLESEEKAEERAV